LVATDELDLTETLEQSLRPDPQVLLLGDEQAKLTGQVDTACRLSIPSSRFATLRASRSSSLGSRCIPTSTRQQWPSPPDQGSIAGAMARQPRRLK